MSSFFFVYEGIFVEKHLIVFLRSDFFSIILGDCESNDECDVNGFCDDGKCKCKENYKGNGYDNCERE